MTKTLKILMCSSEVAPLAKTGGLADVSAELPMALKKMGVDIRIATPKYKTTAVKGNTTILNGGIKVYLIENDKYFGRENLYGDAKGDYPDNLERFSFFSQEALRRAKDDNFIPDIVHCNDWQTALICIYIKSGLLEGKFFKASKTLFTIHNLAYQGLFDSENFSATGLGPEHFNSNEFEFYGKVSLLKAGIVSADMVSTVSPTYKDEILTEKFGCGLEGVLWQRRNDLVGILNGLDYEIWNPQADKNIYKNYSSADLKSKLENKVRLQKELSLKVSPSTPLLGYIGRLDEQKGTELIAMKLNEILKLNAQFVLLGRGQGKYQSLFKKLAVKYKGSVSVNIEFNYPLGQKIYAGLDMFLMPSNFEPCGLGQMISMRYGTVPVTYNIGGLRDTVIDYSKDTQRGTGFLFDEYTAGHFFDAVKRGLMVYANKAAWTRLVKRIMNIDFSWEHSAKEYLNLYKQMLGVKA